jgi:hypothetical protein
MQVEGGIGGAMREASDVDAFNIPQFANFYFAAFIKASVEKPQFGGSYGKTLSSTGFETDEEMDAMELDRPNFEFGFLTPQLGIRFLSKLPPTWPMRTVERLVPLWKVAELLVISDCLCVDAATRKDRWQVFRDPPGHKTAIGSEPDKAFELQTYSDSNIRTFEGVRINMAVEQLDDRVIYCSTAHNRHIANVITVDHRKKMLYLHLVTLSRLHAHKVKVSTLSRVLSGMGIKGRAQDYDVMLLCYQDWTSHEPQVGCAFVPDHHHAAPMIAPGSSKVGPDASRSSQGAVRNGKGKGKGKDTDTDTDDKSDINKDEDKDKMQTMSLAGLRSAYDSVVGQEDGEEARNRLFGAVNPHKLDTRIIRTKLSIGGVRHLLGTGTNTRK